MAKEKEQTKETKRLCYENIHSHSFTPFNFKPYEAL